MGVGEGTFAWARLELRYRFFFFSWRSLRDGCAMVMCVGSLHGEASGVRAVLNAVQVDL